MSYDQQLQTNQEFVTAFLDLQNDVNNNESFLAFVDKYYVNTLDTSEFCTELQQRLNLTNTSQLQLIHCKYAESSLEGVSDHDFFYDISCLYKLQLMMRVTLRSFDNSSDEKLDRIDTWKKASAVSFTAAAAVAATVAAANANTKRPAAAAAAGASVMLVAIGKWIHSLLRKSESAVMKHKKIIRVMTLHAKIAMKDLSNIYVLCRRLRFEIDSTSETVGDGKKVAAVKKGFKELRGKSDDYSRNMNCAKQVVIQSINPPNYGNWCFYYHE